MKEQCVLLPAINILTMQNIQDRCLTLCNEIVKFKKNLVNLVSDLTERKKSVAFDPRLRMLS